MVKSGLRVFMEKEIDKYTNKRIGLLCHAASIDENYKHIIDIFLENGLNITAIFGPQHGLFGETQDNMIEWNGGFKDSKSGAIVYSLYGEHRKPQSHMLENIDVMIIDLQDVGARPYTYIWTLKLCMEACSEAGKEIVILDRPNPVAPLGYDGGILDNDFFSFVGGAQIPMAHSLTIGEIGYLLKNIYYPEVNLKIIKSEGWNRSLFFDETKLPWVLPSPNMPNLNTAVVYPGMVLFEAVNVSEGRGTTLPFEFFGAPFIDFNEFEKRIISFTDNTFILRRHDFIPTFNKFKGERCIGYQIHVTDRKRFKPVRTAALLLYHLLPSCKGEFEFKNPPYEYEFEKMPFDILSGNEELRHYISEQKNLNELFDKWEYECLEFDKTVKEFKLYGDK